MSRPCPYCKSPSIGNPCWYWLNYEGDRDGYEYTPCRQDLENEHDRRKSRERWKFTGWVFLAFAVVALSVWLGFQ